MLKDKKDDIIFYSYEEYIRYMYPNTADEILNKDLSENKKYELYGKKLAEKLGYKKNDIFLLEDGQELVFEAGNVKYGRTIPIKNVYVDELSGEELESFVLRDRQKLSEAGIIIILAEVDSGNGQLVGSPDAIVRGLTTAYDIKRLNSRLMQDFHKALNPRKARVTNWIYIRKLIGEVAERRIYKDLRRRPLVLPVVIEV